MIMNRAVTIMALVGGVLAIIISLLSQSFIFPLIAAVLFTLSILFWRYGYIIIPFFTRATNIVEVRSGYEIPPTRDYVVRKTDSGYLAAKFLEVKFYESSMEKNADEKHTMFESFEKAISSLKYIVKISLMISPLDLSKHIDEIKTKRSTVEAKKAKGVKLAENDSIRMDRELAMWNRTLDRLTQGERPVEVVAFASTTAFGLTRDEAISRVSRQSKELKTILSSSLGCDIRELKDLDMVRCFEWDYFFPTTNEEMADSLY